MTKTKSTKRALLLSALSLLMCVSMLIGSTFAWFTDSVTSAGNKIQSGTLKVDLELLDKDGNWNSIKEDKTALFDYEKWEPGYTEVKMLKVENEGNLALKWIAKFVSANELGILADVIDVYVLPYGVLEDATSVAYPADRNLDGYTKAGTLRQFVNTIETTTYGSLKAGESAYLGIALKMQESAGNEYQDKTLGAFDIQILATQLTSEFDSFDDQYDANAKYPVFAANADELVSTLQTITEETKIDASGVAVDIKTIGTTSTIDGVETKTFTVPDGVTLVGAEINFSGLATTTVTADSTNVVSGCVAFEDCTFTVSAEENAPMNVGTFGYASAHEYSSFDYETTYVFNNCTFEGIIDISGINAEFNNCVFRDSADVKGAILVRYATSTFNDCTFDYTEINALFNLGNMGTSNEGYIYLNNCTLNGVKYVSPSTIYVNNTKVEF